ncbi:hypothetical protein M8818_006080 [Zalaria obscura]|uniref:Uncharacterized protein n=1 Tax=Zalaria obscura TaxID=2024903 RepID=A0ACC3SA12_9PEZI
MQECRTRHAEHFETVRAMVEPNIAGDAMSFMPVSERYVWGTVPGQCLGRSLYVYGRDSATDGTDKVSYVVRRRQEKGRKV